MMESLLCVPFGMSVKVGGLNAAGACRRRLLDLGLTPGAYTTCLYAAPSGNPKAYLIRGAIIALRNEDAGLVGLEPIKE
ncbi:MAG TPA: FeoA family protein [Clostridia bacterium]|nr:FeoA family protein [Clostridia bacterium]